MVAGMQADCGVGRIICLMRTGVSVLVDVCREEWRDAGRWDASER